MAEPKDPAGTADTGREPIPSGDTMAVATLNQDLGIEACVELKQMLAGHLDAPQLQLDAGAVERVHTASLQLLAAWWLARTAARHQTTWSACSDALRSAAGTLGLSAVLGLDGGAQQPITGEDPT